MKPEIIRDGTLDWVDRMMDSIWFERGLITAAILMGAHIIIPALWKIIFK
jgi:hypothetical protein